MCREHPACAKKEEREQVRAGDPGHGAPEGQGPDRQHGEHTVSADDDPLS